MAALSTAVDTDGTGNYTSLDAANIGQAQDLTDGGGDTFEFECEASSGTADTTAATINGFVTAAANYVMANAKSGDQAVKTGWDAGRYRLVDIADLALLIQDNHVRVDGLQIQGNYGIYLSNISAANDIRISNCRLHECNTMGIRSADTDLVLTFYNNIITGAGNDGLRIDSTTATIYNNISYGNTGSGFEFDSGAVTAKNNASFANTGTDFQDDVGGSTIDFNASDDNTGTNNVAESGGGAAWPSDFAAAATGNFTLLVGSNLNGGGTTSTAGTDMDGDAYEDPASVGVDEFVAAGGNAPTGALQGPLGGPLAGVF